MNAITRPGGTALAPVLQPNSFGELVQFAKMAASSDLMPRDYKGKPENIMIAVQMGSEVGLSPMQAIQNIAVVNGRPSLWGDAMLALVRRDPRCLDVAEHIEGDGDARVAVCVVKRANASPITGRFSVDNAKKAGLWGKPGPWQQYPERMMQMRARGFALRDAFPDVLKGLQSAEEARDIPAEPHREPPHAGPTIEARVEPASDIPTLDEPPPTERKRTKRELLRDKLVGCFSRDDVAALNEGDWWRDLTAGLNADQIATLQAMVDEKFRALPEPAGEELPEQEGMEV